MSMDKSGMNKPIKRSWDFWVMVLIPVVVLASACSSGATIQPTQTSVGLPNPASENCVEQGGTHTVETRSDGGQYGVCVFEDNQQCEEFALLRGDCPVGGVKVTGYVTDAGRYCAITGGTYTATGGTTSDGQEAGTCTFANGSTCDVFAYYDGTCSPKP